MLRYTGNKKYQDAVIKNGEWWLKMEGLPGPYASTGLGLVYMADLYRFTGDKRYAEKAEEFAEALDEPALVTKFEE